jgi:hypothetical protein
MAANAGETVPVSPQRHRELFERYCRQKFYDKGRGCSKTLSGKKRDRIVRYLERGESAEASPQFRFWVKNRGFQLVDVDGKRALCLPNKQRVDSDPTSPEWKRVAAVEEFYDIIRAYHITEKGAHIGIKKTLSRISEIYEYLSRSAVEGYMEFCTICRSRARKRSGVAQVLALPTDQGSWGSQPNPLSFMSSVQVDLIDMSQNQDGQYQWIGHFTDHWSCFHVLFPLSSVSSDEVAQNLSRYIAGSCSLVPSLSHCTGVY